MSHRLSVVIPTYNKRALLELSLAGYSNQTFTTDLMEIVVVDDHSTDGTGEWLREQVKVWKKAGAPTLRFVKSKRNGGPGAARNEGVRVVRGQIILFTDADMIPDPGLVSQHVKLQTEAKERGRRIAVVGTLGWLRIYTRLYPGFDDLQTRLFEEMRDQYPNPTPLLPTSAPVRVVDPTMILEGWASRLAFRPDYGLQDEAVVQRHGPELRGFPIPWIFCLTGNVSVWRDDFLATGGFDTSFVGWGAEDWEWGYRLTQAGISFRCVFDAVTYHQEHPIDQQQRGKTSLANMIRFFARHPDPEVMALVLLFAPPWYGVHKIADFLAEWRRMEATGGYWKLLDLLRTLLDRACRRLGDTVDWSGDARPNFVGLDTLDCDLLKIAASKVKKLAESGFERMADVLPELLQAEREAGAW